MASFDSQQSTKSEVSKVHAIIRVTPGRPTSPPVGVEDGNTGVGSVDYRSLSFHRSRVPLLGVHMGEGTQPV